MDFTFRAPTHLQYGPGCVQRLGSVIQDLGAQRVLLVTDGGLVGIGLHESVVAAFVRAGIGYEIFAEVTPNPTDGTISAGALVARQMGADAVVGLGGGSPMDAAKGIAVMAQNPGPVTSYCGAGSDPWPQTPLPVVAIPTTAGTGSEVSAAAMVNLPHEGRKTDLFGPSIVPKVALLDPLLTLDLPPRLTALTGIDALSHAVEAYVCARANPISDAIAERAIFLVAENLRRATVDGSDVDARGNMLVASAMAVIAAANAGGLGVIHSLAQTLGGYYDLPHGLTIAVCFAAGLAFNASVVPEKYAKVAGLMGVYTEPYTQAEAAQAAVTAVAALVADLGIRDDLSSMGVQRADIPKLAALAMLDGCTPPNPRPLTQADFISLYTGLVDVIT